MKRLRVNPILCEADGYCAEIIPERIELDEWGYPIVDPTPITDRRTVGLARRACDTCPRVALFLEDVPEPPTGR